jgi:hypothetical protein
VGSNRNPIAHRIASHRRRRHTTTTHDDDDDDASMGAYLSTPVTSKHSTDGASTAFAYGTTAMQGWRTNMEVRRRRRRRRRVGTSDDDDDDCLHGRRRDRGWRRREGARVGRVCVCVCVCVCVRHGCATDGWMDGWMDDAREETRRDGRLTRRRANATIARRLRTR